MNDNCCYLRFTGELKERAQAEIERLAEEYGGHSVPAHVTLMGGIVDSEEGILARAALLSSLLKVRPSWYGTLAINK